ncbi:hypothetical protein BaRGS_00017404, partial [Batillaria attramentaria]
ATRVAPSANTSRERSVKLTAQPYRFITDCEGYFIDLSNRIKYCLCATQIIRTPVESHIKASVPTALERLCLHFRGYTVTGTSRFAHGPVRERGDNNGGHAG